MSLDMGYGLTASNAMAQYGLNNLPSYDFMKNIGTGLSTLGGYAKTGLDFMDKYSNAIGTVGGLYSAYNQQAMANKMYDLQKDAYNYNKALSDREMKRQEDNEKNFQLGFTRGV